VVAGASKTLNSAHIFFLQESGCLLRPRHHQTDSAVFVANEQVARRNNRRGPTELRLFHATPQDSTNW
jgi:hypothetical protein